MIDQSESALKGNMWRSVSEKVAKSSSRFNALDKLVVIVHSVRMPVGIGGDGSKTRDRPLSVMAHLKGSVLFECEDVEDTERDCARCGKRKHTFWDEPVADMLPSLCEQRPWVNKIIAQRQSLRSPFQPQQSHPVDMAARIDHERTENNVYEDAALGLFRYRVFPPMFHA